VTQSWAAGSGPPPKPTLAPGVVLAGPMPGTGYRTTQWLIQRGDRYVQVSEILYRVAELSDGTRTDGEIAVLVSAETRRNVSAEDVQALVQTKLVPAGIVGDGVATPATASPRSSPLGVQLGTKVIGPGAIEPLARIAQVFFVPGVAIVALAASIGAHIWLYRTHGLGPAFEGVVLEPWRMAALGAIAFAAAAFHELGHATALRVAGGRARGMGFGFYLVYPVLFTDVTDSYRLGRWRRLLTDVGGFYFNLIFALGLFAAYAISRQDWILVAVAIIDFEILHQLLPLGRLDGYWILADLTGVPDFFAVGGAFAQRATGRRAGLPALRPIATVVVVLYLVLIVPAFGLLTYLVARGAPRVATATLESFLIQAAHFDEARAAENLLGGIAAIGQGMVLLLPLLGIALFLLGMASWVLRGFAKVTGRTRGQRVASIVSAAGALALLIALWAPMSTAVTQIRAAEDLAGTSSGAALDPGPGREPTLPATSRPRVLPPAVQTGTGVPASPVRSVRPMTSAPTPSTAPTSPVPTPSPTATPPSASPSPTTPGSRP
jgi:putative peptide zinc metalloprotease protein